MKRAIVARLVMIFDDDGDESKDSRTTRLVQATDSSLNCAVKMARHNFGVITAMHTTELASGPEARVFVDPVSCPFCGSSNIEATEFEQEGHAMWHNTRCVSCDEEWQEVYTRSETDMTKGGDLPWPRKPTDG